MAFDESVAARVRKALARQKGRTERKMFGGLMFLVDGHMCCGVLRDELVLRLGPQGAADALKEPHTRPMDFTGRPSTGMVYVEPAGFASDAALRSWVRAAVRFVKSLPPKPGRGRRAVRSQRVFESISFLSTIYSRLPDPNLFPFDERTAR